MFKSVICCFTQNDQKNSLSVSSTEAVRNYIALHIITAVFHAVIAS